MQMLLLKGLRKVDPRRGLRFGWLSRAFSTRFIGEATETHKKAFKGTLKLGKYYRLDFKCPLKVSCVWCGKGGERGGHRV